MRPFFKYSFFFAVLQTSAQLMNSKYLNGKVIANADDLSTINIENLKTNLTSSIEFNGSFIIPANEGDTLMFSSIQFKRLKIKLKKEDFNEIEFLIKLEKLTYFLEEVTIIDYKKISAVSLGITSKGVKKYTPAERRLYTATGGGNKFGTKTSVSFDGILNAISGKTTMLKKEVKIERKEFTINKINSLFDDNYFIESLKIPIEYINGFKYYIVENNDLVNSITIKNYSLTKFLMDNLALKYLDTISLKK